MKPVVLDSNHRVCTFHRFIFSDPKSRFRCIRSVHLNITFLEHREMRAHISQMILDLLRGAICLESLTLPSPILTLQALGDPRVWEAIAGISTLRTLTLPDDCEDAENIIKTTCSASTLRALCVSAAYHRFPLSELTVASFDGFFARLAPTLQALKVENHELVFDTIGVVYPALRSLTASAANGVWDTGILVAKFPSLDKTFNVRALYSRRQDSSAEERRIRARNMEVQRGRSWTGLDKVIGSVEDMFTLGLTCPIRHLMVHDVRGEKSEILTEVLRTPTTPTHLTLTVGMSPESDLFTKVLPDGALPKVTHLALTLEFRRPPYDYGYTVRDACPFLKMLLGQLEPFLKRFRLTHLRVSMVHNAGEFDAEDPPRDPYIPCFAETDHERLAEELVLVVPSLRYVFLAVWGNWSVWSSPCNTQYFHEFLRTGWARAPDGALEKLSEDCMERIVEAEDLGLSEDGKAKFPQ
ncbi:hypothetical protein C8Q77DRAFT_1159825 [Trametes polyzona]|nr:hypothetical protein C8Q77DRAFT_1159825 [Trametes polyzona]